MFAGVLLSAFDNAGGDTVSALKALNLHNDISHCSTGGGAGLALIEGKAMPGLQAMVAAN
jgi:phosphoglycerate kinase